MTFFLTMVDWEETLMILENTKPDFSAKWKTATQCLQMLSRASFANYQSKYSRQFYLVIPVPT